MKRRGDFELDLVRTKRSRSDWSRERRRRNQNRKNLQEGISIGILLGVLIGLFLGVATVSILKHDQNIEVSEVVSTEEVEETEVETEKEPEAKYIKIKLQLAKHTIAYEASGANRNKNMEIAARTINGYILQPGEKFSWLEVVGNTTAEKGYVEAGSIQNGNSAIELGGGVCQVSSTLYSAVYDAGIIREGHYDATQHSVTSKYINPDVDHEATVAIDHEPKTDFWFENTLECPIVINAWTVDCAVVVKIDAIVYVQKEIQE